MADSSTNLEQIETSQVQKEVTANGLFDACSVASAFGRHAEESSGLTWGYYGVRYGGLLIGNGTNVCGASTVTYMVIDFATGTPTFATSTTNWNDDTNYGRCFKITSGASAITAWEDHRFGPGGIFSGGGAGIGSVTAADVTVADAGGYFGSPVVTVESALAILGAHAGGDVVGPSSAVSHNIARFNGTTGKIIEDSGLTLAGTNTGDETAATIATILHAASGKTTPVDADEIPIADSAASYGLKKLTWANLKATAKTYFDSLYQALDSDLTTIAGLTATTDSFIQSKSSAWASRTVAQVTTDLQGDGLTGAVVGFRNIPQNSKSAAYTTVAADSGKHIFHPAADTTARIFTIDSNANVAYPIGTAITIINEHGAGVITIAITSDTMRLAGTGTTGSRTLAADGMATAIKITSTSWIISGSGLT